MRSTTAVTVKIKGGTGLIVALVCMLLSPPSKGQEVSPADLLINHWKFDGNAQDSIGPFNGTVIGDEAYVAGKFGQAISLDGRVDYTNYVSVSEGTVVVPATDYTLTAWVYWEAGNGMRARVAGGQAGGALGEVFTLGRSATDTKLFLNLLINELGSITETADGAIPSNQWIHVAYSVDSVNGTKLYTNGVVAAINTGRTTHNPDDTFWIGGHNNAGSPGDFMDGLIDDVAIFNGVLTTEQLVTVRDTGADPGDPVPWSNLATTNIQQSAAWAVATVDANLTDAVLVWDTTDNGTGSTNDWPVANRLSLGSQSAGADITGQMTSLQADTTYFWRFYGATATTNGWSSAETFATSLSSAQKPVFTNAIARSALSIELGWQDNASHETGYILQRSTTDGSGYATIANLGSNTTSYTDTGLSSSTTYYYQLAATNSSNFSSTDFSLCRTNATTDVGDPDIAVYDGGTLIASGGSAAFGTVGRDQVKEKLFDVKNLATATDNLFLTGEPAVVFSENGQTNYNGFVIVETISGSATNVTIDGSVSFTIQFSSSLDGDYAATVSILNSDSGNNPYTFTVTANVDELWGPADTETIAWYDAADASTITESSGAVSLWADKSGNGYDLEQASASARPHYTTLNGLGAVRHQYQDYVEKTSGMGHVFTTGVTVVAVQSITGGSYCDVWWINTSTTNQLRMRRRLTTSNYQLAVNDVSSGDIGFAVATAFMSSIDYVDQAQVYHNGALKKTVDPSGTFSLDSIRIGWVANAGTDATVGEMVILEGADVDKRQTIEGYLAHKWGLASSLPNEHPYKDTPPLAPPLAGTVLILR